MKILLIAEKHKTGWAADKKRKMKESALREKTQDQMKNANSNTTARS